MGEMLAHGLILPVIVLGVAGLLMPRLLARILPEGVRPLMLNALLSTLLLWTFAAVFFLALYLWQGVSLEILMRNGTADLIFAFGQLGLQSALIWLPIMVLSLAGLPGKWVHETW